MRMRENIHLLPVVLDLFDGTGTGGAGGGTAPGGGTALGGRTAPGSGTAPGGRTAPGGGQTLGQTRDGRPGGWPAAGEDRTALPNRSTENGPQPVPEELLAQRRRAEMGRARCQERAQRQLQNWSSQAAQAKALYPGFDLGREARNQDFLSMLRSGVPVRQAYEVVHMDQIMAATAAMQARATEKAITANIKAKGTRPQENGAGASSGFTVKDDVSRLTARDRAEMARRAARGEVITF